VTTGVVFLDRDGTIIRDAHYLATPAGVELLPGAAGAIRRLNEAGFSTIVVTNQAGIARGRVTEAQFAAVTTRLAQLLSEHGARIDATYMCPHHPEFTGPCDCRKPGTLLFRRAARDLGLDLDRSWYVGDKLRDVSPARELGGTGILVPGPETSGDDIAAASPDILVLASLDGAITHIIDSARS
jgi:D-glycero-D-manno-heptose 1,7-bisphosphate phosphatase